MFFPALLCAQIDNIQPHVSTEDELIATRIFSFALKDNLSSQPMGKIITAVGYYLARSRYEEHTLDRSEKENLVVNLHSFDCVTYVENVLALARSINGNHLTIDSYRKELEALRYRHAQRNGYESRLHYFSEWISDNEKKKILHNLTDSLGGHRVYKPIVFLSHRGRSVSGYLTDSSLHQIRQIEQRLTADSLNMIPTAAVPAIVHSIRDGDIIAVTTNAPGLDVGHTGFAVRDRKGVLRLLHASEATRRVEITRESLIEYLRKHRNDTGIMVARPIPPER